MKDRKTRNKNKVRKQKSRSVTSTPVSASDQSQRPEAEVPLWQKMAADRKGRGPGDRYQSRPHSVEKKYWRK